MKSLSTPVNCGYYVGGSTHRKRGDGKENDQLSLDVTIKVLGPGRS